MQVRRWNCDEELKVIDEIYEILRKKRVTRVEREFALDKLGSIRSAIQRRTKESYS